MTTIEPAFSASKPILSYDALSNAYSTLKSHFLALTGIDFPVSPQDPLH